jgi:hypothetical protein
MRRARPREFHCEVVSETVLIRLTRASSFGSAGYFIRCNQADCQYVEANKPPCPLHVGLFADEIEAAAAARAERQSDGAG